MDDTETGAALTELGAATLGESGALAMPARMRRCGPERPWPRRPFRSRCTPGDNLAVHVAVARAPAGSALVVDVGDVPDRGYWGEVLTTAAQSKGLAGLVIDGGVRDVAAWRGWLSRCSRRRWPSAAPPNRPGAPSAPPPRWPESPSRWRLGGG